MAEPAIVLFDGACGLCSAAVMFLLDHEAGDQFRFASMQSAAGEQLIRRHGLPSPPHSMVMIESGKAYVRSDGAARLARRLRWPWSLAQWVVVIPEGLRDALYDRLAANRYRWFGMADACRMPVGRQAMQFLAPADVPGQAAVPPGTGARVTVAAS